MRKPRILCQLLLGLLFAGVWAMTSPFSAQAATTTPWVNLIENGQDATISAVIVDDQNNVYATGTFRGTVDFDPGPASSTLTSNVAQGSYIVKYNSNGELLWLGPLIGNDNVLAMDIAIDSLGYLAVTGSFEGTADLDPGPGGAQFDSEGSSDIFLIRVDPNGNLDWGYSAGDGDSDVGLAVAIDAFNDIYITGSFEDEVTFDPFPFRFTLSSAGKDDAFVARFTSFGRIEWVRQYGGDEDDEGHDVGVDANRNIYVTGVFEDDIDLDAGFTGDERTSKGKEDIFVTSLNEAGNHRGAFQIGGRGSERSPQILVEPDGSFYLSGQFAETADFDLRTDAGLVTSRGDSDFFLARYDTNQRPLWLYANGSGGSDTAEGLGRDILGNVYLTGAFEGLVDFDPSQAGTTLISQGEDDVYVASFEANGTVRAVQALRGEGDSEPSGIAVDATGNLFVVGNFTGALDFGNGLTAADGDTVADLDSFIAKLSSTDWLPGLTTLYLPGLPPSGTPVNEMLN